MKLPLRLASVDSARPSRGVSDRSLPLPSDVDRRRRRGLLRSSAVSLGLLPTCPLIGFGIVVFSRETLIQILREGVGRTTVVVC